jgi:hypothetical protein
MFELADEVLPAGFEDRAFGRDVELACTALDRWATRISRVSPSGVDRRLADTP